MKKKTIFIAALSVFIFSCADRVPITNRRQLSIVSESDLIKMSVVEYDSVKRTSKTLPPSDPRDQLVQRVGNRVKNAIVQYLGQHNQSDRIDGFVWEFHTLDSPQVNAWCMPGGKVAVYTGILPVTQDEPSLAIVLGHEIGHAIARHGNERMSEQMVVQGLGSTLSLAAGTNPSMTKSLFLQAYNVGSQIGLLKYSRDQESEADKLGLVFAAMAGYDPHVAVTFWQRMEESSKGQATPPVFLSTHPSDAQRVEDIKAFLPTAMKYYQPAK